MRIPLPSSATSHSRSIAHGRRLWWVLLAASLGAACADRPADSAAVSVREIRPGVAAGYLAPEELPDSAALLPPPPSRDSAAFAADRQVSEVRKLRDTPRGAQALLDDDLSFPNAAGIFSCALKVPVSESLTPRLYALLRRTRTDAAAVSDAAKDHYRRPRPFTENHDPTCTPAKEAGLATNGSYPSGHTSVGWAWALILSEAAPEQANAILARGRSYGESRLICNAHWQSDVLQGRFMGASVVARLHANAEFRADLDAAKAEIAALRGKGLEPSRDCAAESAGLAEALPNVQ